MQKSPDLKKQTKNIISIAFLLIFIGLAVYYVINNADAFTVILDAKPGFVMLSGLCALIFWMFTGVRLYLVLQLFDLKLKFREWFGLVIITKFFSYFLPFRGGMVARAYYLKKQYDFEYAKFLGSTMGLYMLSIFLNCLLGFIILIIYNRFDDERILTLTYLLAAAIAGIVLLAVLSVYFNDKFKYKFITRITKSINLFTERPGILAKLVLNHLAIRLFWALSIYFIFHSLSIEIPALEAT
ncbi:MAG: flippase-like domain-containing protein, partial [Bacteroidetes bacterium]|nr:flippase-like domain-containing protein [Bacteroidota bacterium]